MNFDDLVARTKKINNIELRDNFMSPIESFGEYVDCNIFNSLDIDTPIYRVMKYDIFKTSFQQGCLSMKNPSSWNDPMEGFIYKCPGVFSDGTKVSLRGLLRKIYAMCWSTKKESELMWAAYSHDAKNNAAIKIQSTPRKIMKYFYEYPENFAHYNSYFVGKIEYVDLQKYIEILSSTKFADFSGSGRFHDFLINSLFIKTLEHSDEEEVRFVFYAPDETCDVKRYEKVINRWNIHEKLFSFKIDLNEAIDEIIFHPSIDDSLVDSYINEIIGMGYKNSIKKSEFYKNLVIDLDFSNHELL